MSFGRFSALDIPRIFNTLIGKSWPPLASEFDQPVPKGLRCVPSEAGSSMEVIFVE
jgi:hypothetical protein